VTNSYFTPFRIYETDTREWLSRDPIGEAGGLNLYGYCLDDPINKWDALGLACITQFKNSITSLVKNGQPITFTADDLNNAVAAIYSEASNNATDQTGVASVLINRIGAKGIPGGPQNTFTGVANAPNQFAGVSNPKTNAKYQKARSTSPCDWSDAAAKEYNSAYDQLANLLHNNDYPGGRYPYNSFNSGQSSSGDRTQLAPGGNYYYNQPGISGPYSF
jgi:hypothetical protein